MTVGATEFCKRCIEPFVKRRWNQKFCDAYCQRRYNNTKCQRGRRARQRALRAAWQNEHQLTASTAVRQYSLGKVKNSASICAGRGTTQSSIGKGESSMSLKWSLRSRKEMAEIHPDLRRICDVALSLVGSKYTFLDFIIIDGRRTIDEQRLHVARGASKTMNSRHLHGYAVDFAAIVDGKIRWEPSYFKLIGAEFKNAAAQCRTPIKWGGDWKWKDWGHIELDRKRYPDP